MNKPPAIVVDHLIKRFGPFVAVNDISFEVGQGEIFGFLGANGAGKSTTIRILCGLMSPSAGVARVAGFDVATQAEAVKRSIGYMAQKFALYGDLTVAENITFWGGMYGLPSRRIDVRRSEVSSLLDLGDVQAELAGDLPRGFQQRLAFACALLHEPRVIFLDEPTGGVDPLQRRTFWDQIYDIAATGVTIFVTTHFLDEAEFCERICLLAAGSIVALDTPKALKARLADRCMYEVECHPAVTALELLRRQAWVQGASIFGSAIHVRCAAEPTASARLTALLQAGAVQVTRCAPIEPGLEDVFLTLVENAS
jgi:ABC-2 type transport system ATP-binding protein